MERKNMTETIVTPFVVICLLLYKVAIYGVPDFLFHNPDQTACLTMRYTSPWETEVDVDNYVRKSEYKKRIETNFVMNELNMDITRRNIDFHFRNFKTNIFLFVKSRNRTNTHLAVLSHFVCVNSIPNEKTPHHVVLAYHVCDIKNENTRSPSTFIRNIIGKIANEIPEFGNMLLNDKWIQEHTSAHNCELDPFVCINAGLIIPLSRVTEKPAFKNIILISGIDQCKNLYHEHQESSVSLDILLNKTVSRFPPWIKFLFISNKRHKVDDLFPLFHQEFYDDDELLPMITHVKYEYGGQEYSFFFMYFIGILLVVIAMFCCYIEGNRNEEERANASRTLFLISLWLRYITPSLFTESFRGKLANVRYFLDVRRANINEKHNQIGLSPLHLAALNGHHHVCEYLLYRLADPNIKADLLCYPYLLGYNSDESNIYFGDCKDATALRLAILFDQELCVKLLLEKGREMTSEELSLCIRISSKKENIEQVLLKYVADCVIKKYSRLKFLVRYCYIPGPSNERVVMCYTHDVYNEIKEEYLGVIIRIQNPNIIDDEDSIMFETQTKNNNVIDQKTLFLMEKAIHLHGDRLFQNHSNLNSISVSAARLSKTTEESEEKKGPCIVLYCTTKGVIPFNEKTFPEFLYIDEEWIMTDIREGYFSLCPGGVTPSDWNNTLRSGGSIGIKGDYSQEATMGPFVQLRDGTLGFITCAHLFNNVNRDLKTYIMQPSCTLFTSLDITEEDKVCGYLVDSIFEPDRNVSIDAALVKITSRVPDRGRFAINSRLEVKEAGMTFARQLVPRTTRTQPETTHTQENKENLGFDGDNFPVFDSGSVKREISPEDASKIVIKFGSNTGLTRGAFRLNGAQVRVKRDVDLTTPINPQTFTMKGQYEIQSVGPTDFFQPGDSGSGVYIVDENKQIHCIGIAIGCTKYRSAIVTPIKDVLEALRLPRKLKTFVPENMQH